MTARSGSLHGLNVEDAGGGVRPNKVLNVTAAWSVTGFGKRTVKWLGSLPVCSTSKCWTSSATEASEAAVLVGLLAVVDTPNGNPLAAAFSASACSFSADSQSVPNLYSVVGRVTVGLSSNIPVGSELLTGPSPGDNATSTTCVTRTPVTQSVRQHSDRLIQVSSSEPRPR